MKFEEMELSAPILRAIAEKGYDTPTAIQARAIPAVLEGRDIMAAAQTGTGKTAAFVLPILKLLSNGESVKPDQARVLILTPTRELAAQVNDNIQTYGKHLKLRSAVVFGGVNINAQIKQLRRGVDILVATPGRLLDLHSRKSVKFDQLSVLVLDEADRMLDMGFIPDIRRILKVLPEGRQSLLFSATFSKDIRKLAAGIMNDPIEISVTPRNTTVEAIEQWVYPVDKARKPVLLTKLIKEHEWRQVLVFTRTKHGANRLSGYLCKNNVTATAIHGNKSQGARTRALNDFKQNRVRILVATDIAARGLDISQLPHVVNFDLPNVPEDYVHRIGRTGRAGAKGEAVSLVCNMETKELKDIERLIDQSIPRRIIDGFEPVRALKDSGQGSSRSGRAKTSGRPQRGESQKPRSTKPVEVNFDGTEKKRPSKFGKRKWHYAGATKAGRKRKTRTR